jgi:CrcB protein
MLLWIALGGAAGSVLRYLIGGAAQKMSGVPFPVGTFVVNVTGCFLIGILAQQ